MGPLRTAAATVLAFSFVVLPTWAEEPPKVQIPDSGLPQIMTMEGRYVRAAYNNEGYVILGYRLANLSVGEQWMLLEVGFTLPAGRPDFDLHP